MSTRVCNSRSSYMVLLGHAYAAMPRVRRLESQSSLGLQQLHSFHMFSVWSLLGRTWSGLVGWRILVKRPLTPRCYSPLQSEGQPQQAVVGQRVECVYGANQLLMIFGILWLFRVVLKFFCWFWRLLEKMWKSFIAKTCNSCEVFFDFNSIIRIGAHEFIHNAS